MKKWNIIYTRWIIGLFLIIVLFSSITVGFNLNLKKTSNSLYSNLFTSNSHVFDLNCIWRGPDNDYASSAATDSLGNIYLVGYSYSYSEGLEDILLVKFNPTGALEWFTTWGGNDYDYGFGIAVDSFNDIYVTGSTHSFGAGKEDIITIKFNSFGDQLWNTTWGGTEYDRGNDIKIDSDNNLYVGGRTDSFGAFASEAVILKYNISGSLIWEAMWEGGTNENTNGIAIDSQNNIYITGLFQNLTKANQPMNSFIVKYNSSGIYQWSRSWGGNNYDSASKIVVDSFNNLYVGGTTYSFGNGEGDIFLLKYDSSGALQSNITWGTNGNDMFYGISVDSSDNLYSLYELESITLPNTFLIKFNQSGNLVSNKSIESRDINPYNMVIDSLDNLYITGSIYDTEDADIFLYRFGIDFDEDGLSDWQEINVFFTDPNNPDTDEDFLKDGEELNEYNTDPFNNDTDSDGLLDGQEVNIYFTNPLSPDTDGDTLSDGDEVNIYHTDPTLMDSDGDGFRDDMEVALGFDPNDPSNPMFLIIIISSIILLAIFSSTFVLYRRNMRSKFLREREIYEKIPNLKILIRNYVYHQLRAIHDEMNISNIELEDLEDKIREQLYLNIDNFLQFLELEGIKLTKNQINFLKIDSFEESEPIRKELTQIITQKLEDKQLEDLKRDLEIQLQEELQISNDPAYQEQIKNKYQMKFDSLRSVNEKIDTLLDQYAKWDKSDELKKV
jgi:uncharacterized delta-60 repeat protein